MKKISFVLVTAAIIMAAACSSQEYNDESLSSPSTSSFSNKIRSYEEALKIAQSSATMFDNQKASSRGGSKTHKIDFTNSKKVVKLDARTRSDLEVNDTLIYVFNFENDEGFILISASENTEAVLAITEQGNYNPEVRSEIEGFELFMDLAKNYVVAASKQTRSRNNTRGFQKDTMIHSYTITVEPYITVNWGQICPEGEFCPNGISGCVNTAMAQVMTYYQYPSGISLTYNGADLSYQNLNWADMKSHNTCNQHYWYSSSCNNQNSHKAIARLLRQLGELTQSSYNSDGTASTVNNSRQTLSNMGYNISDYYYYSGAYVREELEDGHLILADGDLYNSYGHLWVIDGYLTDIATECVMEQIDVGNHTLWVIIDEYGSGTYYYNHINWGWYGHSNGYFLDGVFNTALVIMPESLTNNNYNYYDIGIYSVYH